jgi:MFS family permease
MDVGLERFGFRTMLRAWAVAIVVLTVPLMYYVRPRIPRSATATSLRRFDFSYFKSPIFWTYQGCNIINGLGYFIPGTYMPTYAEAIHSPRIGGTLALALFNAASVLGNMAVGHLVDRTSHVSNIMLVVAVVSMLNIFIFWGLSLNLPMLLVFAVIYGMSAGGFSTMWSGMMKEIQKKFINTNTGILFGTFAAGRGIGAVVSGPLSEALLKTHTWQGSGGFGYGTGFGTLIVFTGTTAAAGSIAYGVRRIGWI